MERKKNTFLVPPPISSLSINITFNEYRKQGGTCEKPSWATSWLPVSWVGNTCQAKKVPRRSEMIQNCEFCFNKDFCQQVKEERYWILVYPRQYCHVWKLSIHPTDQPIYQSSNQPTNLYWALYGAKGWGYKATISILKKLSVVGEKDFEKFSSVYYNVK